MMCLASISASAQYHYTDANNPEMLHHVASKAPCRKVFTLPVVNGYNIYLADLHTHSAYSDGSVLLEGKNPVHIEPHSAVRMTIDKNTKMLKMSIINMWCSADSHPVVELGF